jgi:(2Fe-2S) ferredoxin
MQKPDYHFFVCNSFRGGEATQGACSRKGGLGLMQHLESEIGDRGLNAMVTSAGCLQWCVQGPVMVLHPQNLWFGGVTEGVIDSVLDTLEKGGLPEETTAG